jgi:tRNA(Ile2) C34 agmatinyltransferase TiaS
VSDNDNIHGYGLTGQVTFQQDLPAPKFPKISDVKLKKLSRQRRWQLKRLADGKCEICGRDRGKGRESKHRCKKCERNHYLSGKKAKAETIQQPMSTNSHRRRKV